jgi:DNA-directed RNA polymerase specialized sigma24 family protein
LDGFIHPTEELKEAFNKSFELELDRVEGIVGIELGAKSERKDSAFKADEVRRLLWRGFAGKMLSQGYDPEDVLQEVYRGLLVRNKGKCPWDGRKSTFGHYVFLVIGCVLTNYHRKQIRRIDKEAVPLTLTKTGDEMADIGQYGSCHIEYGSELGDMIAIDELSKYLATLPDSGPEAVLGREILALVASGHQRGEIVRETGRKPSLVSRALSWLRRQTALWATETGLGKNVPVRYLIPTA